MLFFLNPLGIILVVLCLVISYIIYRNVGSIESRILSIGNMTMLLTFLIGFAYPIYYLGDLSDIEVFGHNVALSLFMIVLGILINIICKLIARFTK